MPRESRTIRQTRREVAASPRPPGPLLGQAAPSPFPATNLRPAGSENINRLREDTWPGGLEGAGFFCDDVISLPGTPRTPVTPSRPAMEELAAMRLSSSELDNSKGTNHEAGVLLQDAALQRYLAAEQKRRDCKTEASQITSQIEHLTPAVGHMMRTHNLNRLPLPDGGAIVLAPVVDQQRVTAQRFMASVTEGLIGHLH